jgi:hypothetical protein
MKEERTATDTAPGTPGELEPARARAVGELTGMIAPATPARASGSVPASTIRRRPTSSPRWTSTTRTRCWTWSWTGSCVSKARTGSRSPCSRSIRRSASPGRCTRPRRPDRRGLPRSRRSPGELASPCAASHGASSPGDQPGTPPGRPPQQVRFRTCTFPHLRLPHQHRFAAVPSPGNVYPLAGGRSIAVAASSQDGVGARAIPRPGPGASHS